MKDADDAGFTLVLEGRAVRVDRELLGFSANAELLRRLFGRSKQLIELFEIANRAVGGRVVEVAVLEPVVLGGLVVGCSNNTSLGTLNGQGGSPAVSTALADSNAVANDEPLQ